MRKGHNLSASTADISIFAFYSLANLTFGNGGLLPAGAQVGHDRSSEGAEGRVGERRGLATVSLGARQ